MDYNKPYTYGISVKISNWQDRLLSHPLDNAHPKRPSESYYQTFGDPNYRPKLTTTTQEQQESGIITNTEFRQVAKAQINFVTYPMNDFRFDNYGPREPMLEHPKTTTYAENYKPPKPIVKKIDNCDEVLDPLLNRKPRLDFEYLPSSTNKFMDDHLVHPEPGRKKIDFLRQLRGLTKVFTIDEDYFDFPQCKK